MSEIIAAPKEVVARKHHECNACYWFCRAGYADSEFEPDDLLVIQAARANKWRILPGEAHMVSVCRGDSGMPQRLRFKQPMANINDKYGLWPDD